MTHSLIETAQAGALMPQEEFFVFPASFGQQRLWFLDQFEPNSPYYNIPCALRLGGALDADVLARALNEVVRRHEILRTTFIAENGEPFQVVASRLTLPLPVIDLRHLSPGEREIKARRLADEEARKPFDLARGPLLRAALLRLEETEHLALFTMHHIIADAWSMGVLVQEVSALYQAILTGRPSPLPELPIQYADFACWQRDWLQGEVLERQLAYWKARLGDAPPVLDLPTDRPRPAVRTSRGATRSVTMARDLTDALADLSRRERVTLFMTLVAAFQALLYRYTGQEDISIGTPIAGRNRAEIEGLIGLFINTLVLRTDLSGEPTFRELLARVRAVTLEAYAHQDLPFEKLVDALQLDRDLSYSPLFQVMFILQNVPVRSQAESSLTMSQLDVNSGTSTFDLTLSVAEQQEGLEVSAEFNTDLFDAATIERMLSHFRVLLDAVVRDPDQSIARLPMLTQAERHQLLVEWNDTAFDDPRQGLPLQALFEGQAARVPDATAVVLGDDRLTYGELNRRANQLAHYLRRFDLAPDTPVALCLDRSLEMVVAVLGVLKAGAAYLPLDPLHPEERLGFMLADARAPLLLTQEALAGKLGSLVAPEFLLCLDRDWPAIAGESDANPVCRSTPEHLAYLVYTSGSTGQAKGALVPHRCLVNAFLAWERAYDLPRLRSHLQMANFAFDVFSGDLVRALCSGAKLVICPRELLLEPRLLYGLILGEEVECAEFVPAVLRPLLQYLEQSGQRLDGMRVLLCGSDTLFVGEYRRCKRLCAPTTRVINSFGLTEATIDSSYYEGEAPGLAAEQTVPIGRPFGNMRLYILDAHGEPAPVGVAGELYVGGAGVSRGYLRRLELTAERFLPDRFDGTGMLYRTGDRARYRPDGTVEFLGRGDAQVKIRGFRVELGEIEATLAQHPDVSGAAVVAREGGAAGKRLVAYVVAREEIVAAEEPLSRIGALRSYLKEHLPEYMVPAARDFVLLPSLPLTRNGKVDRRALPAPDLQGPRPEGEQEHVAPRTPVEETLAALWAQVLEVERIGVHDDFFALGGHSLLATQLVSRVREAFEIELPLRHVFESPTIAALAEQVEVALRSEAGLLAPPIRPVPRDGDLPLSFAQQRLWFLDQLEPGSPFYNLPETVRLHGPLNVPILQRALNEIVRRHEVLRTTFSTVDGRPRQVIALSGEVPLSVEDLRPLPREERETEARRRATLEVRRPFDLARGPLLRARLLQLEDEEHIVLLTMHHICGDDWSTTVLTQEIAVLYHAFRSGQPSPLPELPIQYADFAAWQRLWLQGEVLERQLTYWTRQLAGSPPLLSLPTDRPRPAVQSFVGSYLTFCLPPCLSEAIRSLARQEGATLFMTLLAAFQTLLSRYSGQEDVCVGTPIAGRNRAEIEGLIGFFVNTLVLRADLSGRPSFRELLARVREVALGAYAHQDLPFEMLVDALQPPRDMSHSPLFQVMFALQNAPENRQPITSDLSLAPIEAHLGVAKFDLTLFIAEEADGPIRGALEYNTDLFDAATIQRMLGHFRILLEGIVADPDRPVAALPLLTEAERHQLLVEWNDTEVLFPHDRCAHELFAAQAAATPDAIALRCGEHSLTYRALDRRANQLAHALLGCGVGPETLVALCTERTFELVVGLLGILKSGAAYLPLDPSYPSERLAFMLEDSGAPVLLTQRALAERLFFGRPVVADRQLLCLDSDWPTIARESEECPPNRAAPENLAYCIYTSGSTGRPKGSLIEHRGLVNYLTWCQRAYPLGEGSGAPVHSSISFDLTITSLLAPLVAGGTVRLLSEDLGVDTLCEALRRERGFSLVKLTPAHLQLLGQQLRAEEAAGRTRAFIIGGENLTGEHLAFWQREAPETVLINEYGPTETVVGCCVYEVPVESRMGSVPIGRPIMNCQLYVLDGEGEPAPVGVEGELYIGGVGVGRGYLNREELTREKFVADPFGGRGGRLYRTGDRARWRASGELEFLGRRDEQVKVRGFRIELGEIEAALGEHPGVREVAVAVREQASGGTRLVAYLVGSEQRAPGAGELRAFLQERLPEYMVPAAYVRLEALPLTANGKVDRAALPAPESERSALHGSFVAPRTKGEEILAGVWAEVLGLNPVGVEDNFFELGGDSIQSIQVIARANQAGLRLTPRQLFEQPTIAGLAAIAEKEAAPFPADAGEQDDLAAFGWDAEDLDEIRKAIGEAGE